MKCRLCFADALTPVPFDVPAESGEWLRCGACGSDSATHAYDASAYRHWDEYNDHWFEATGIARGNDAKLIEYLRKDCSVNCDWFDRHHNPAMPKTFLDVGCAHGAALDAMQSRGWAVHGFDVARPPYFGPHVTVSSVFNRWMFPIRFAAVLAREVWEHVDCPCLFLHELHGSCLPGGLVEVQTPRPQPAYHKIVYCRGHLHVASEPQLRKMLAGSMLDVIDTLTWDIGQAYLCRAR